MEFGEITKNETRISSLFQTWTVQSMVKSLNNERMDAYFVAYFSCDSQMKGNGCSISNCSEINNDICTLDSKSNPSCNRMEDTVVDWSDAVAFFYIGAEVKYGTEHKLEMSSGDWVGPYNIIFAKNEIDSNSMNDNDEKDIIDSYTIRYINSPNTPYMKMPLDCNIVNDYEKFSMYLGPSAVNFTVNEQSSSSFDTDPYLSYYETCKNGDVQPILPSVRFDFIQDTETGNETIKVKFDYKILSLDYHEFFPKLQKQGYPIAGPYCYDNDPGKAYAFDLSFDSGTPNDNTKIYHSCVKGLPCIPTSIENCNCNNQSDINPVEPESTTVGKESTIYLSILFFFLAFFVVVSWRWNRKQREKLKRLQTDDVTLSYKDYVKQEDEDSKGLLKYSTL